MPVAASKVFEFLEKSQTWAIEKYEITCRSFSTLRRAFRTIILTLADGDDGEELAYEVRNHIAKALTVPIRFDQTTLRWVESVLGTPESVRQRWGQETGRAYEHARVAAHEMEKAESPLRLKLREILLDLKERQTDFRIYSHKTAQEDFRSLLNDPADESLMDDRFLHSVKAYSEVEPFDALIKVGPLRSRGWGAAPDALLTAPRFRRLIQLVWSGCRDEEDFGYDPATVSLPAQSSPNNLSRVDNSASGRGTTWDIRLTTVGDNLEGPDGDLDDLRFFRDISQNRGLCHAVLVQIDERRGILFPPEARLSSFDPCVGVEDAIDYRVPVVTLEEGMFLIWPDLDEPDLGPLKVAQGRYSAVWKSHLREAFTRDPDDLLRRLRTAGIKLRHLRFRVRYWCKPPSNVIHAPKNRKHFEILIKALRIDPEESASAGKGREWWEYAWEEIAKAVGEAIHIGFQEHEIIHEELLSILRELLPSIRELAQAGTNFVLNLPTDRSLEGAVQFYKIFGIDEGFLVPDITLRVVSDLDELEQWRA